MFLLSISFKGSVHAHEKERENRGEKREKIKSMPVTPTVVSRKQA